MFRHTLTVKELIPNALLILNDDILGGTHIQSIKATKKQCVWRMGKMTLPLMTPPLIKLKHNPRTIEKGTCAKVIPMISSKIKCHLPQKCRQLPHNFRLIKLMPSICPTQDIPRFLLRRLAHLGIL